MADVLEQVRQKQFHDRKSAEKSLLEFLRLIYSDQVVRVTLRPSAVSLNSINGVLDMRDGRRRFFKSHTESDLQVSELYNAAVLADAGYPVMRPEFSSTRAGEQVLVYPLVEDPSVFELAWRIDCGDTAPDAQLMSAQHRSDRELLDIYRRSLRWQSAGDASQAPIHQLFTHRLTGGRLDAFLGPDKLVDMPFGICSASDLRRRAWRINGQIYPQTLDDLIEGAILLLRPSRPGPAVVGHGDAHNGNVFLSGDRLVFFDPAFAGTHDPLLDVAKPLFHNVFASWMYFPEAVAMATTVSAGFDDGTIRIDHDYALTRVRVAFLHSKICHTVLPLVQELRRHDWLAPDWRQYLKAALFCCALLTVDLTDRAKYSADVCALGLAVAVEMGGSCSGRRSVIDVALDHVEAALRL